MITLVNALLSCILTGPGSELCLEPTGHGCCSGETPPTLELADASRDGEHWMLELSGRGAPASQLGWLLAGPRPLDGFDPGNGGHYLHLDPTQLIRLKVLAADADGAWRCRLPVGSAALQHARPVFQAAFVDPGMSIGWALSDAAMLRPEGSSLED